MAIINILNEKPSKKVLGLPLFNAEYIDRGDLINKIVLDIGCGFGWMELYAAKRKIKKIIGIEPDKKSLETARKSIKNKKIDFSIGDALRLPFAPNTFDTVLAWEVLEHIPKNSEYRMFKEVNRVLKKNGSYYLSTPHFSLRSACFDPAWWFLGHRHYHVNFLTQIAAKAGFYIERIDVRGGWWEIIGVLNMYIAKWIFRQRPFFYSYLSAQQKKDYETEGFAHIFCKFVKK